MGKTRLGVAAMVTLLLGACGGSGAGDVVEGGQGVPFPQGEPVDVEFLAHPAWDGSTEDTGHLDTTVGNAVAGNYNTGRKRAYFSFDAHQLPDGATIKSATFILYQNDVVGDPYGLYGPAMVDHVAYENPFIDFSVLVPEETDIGTLSISPTEGHRSIEVTAQVQADVDAGRDRVQFRVHHVVELPGMQASAGLSRWAAGETIVEERRPHLLITYTK